MLMTPFIIFFSFLRTFLYISTAMTDLSVRPGDNFLYGALTTLQAAYDYHFVSMVVIAVGGCMARAWDLPTYQTIILPILNCLCFHVLIGTGIGGIPVDANTGFLTAFVVSVSICHLYHFLLRRLGLTRGSRSPAFRPTAHNIAYSMIPVSVILLACVCLRQTAPEIFGEGGLDAGLRGIAADFMIRFYDHPLFAHSLLRLIVQCFWFFGINGGHVLNSVFAVPLSALLDENLVAGITDEVPPNILTLPVHVVFLLMGGSGNAFALLLAILMESKNRNIREVGKLALIPALFNMNEILLFGLPVVCNPIFLLPFLLVPLINLQIAYWATYVGLVPIIVRDIPWTMPFFFNAFEACGGAGVLLQLFLLALDAAIYLPFVAMNDAARLGRFSALTHGLEDLCRKWEEELRPFELRAMKDETRLAAMSLIRDLRRTIAAGKLYMVYQPQYNAAGKLVGAEALLRWDHPTVGLIYPPLVAALAKCGKDFPALERFIFRKVCEDIALMKGEIGHSLKISLNITGDSLRYQGFEESLSEAMGDFGVKPEELWLELTEQDAVASTPDAMERLVQLKKSGHRLLIDDFGMGHTSITYLSTNLFDVVKLDGSITRSVLESENSRKIIASLVGLSRRMELIVVAEFVDNEEQRDKLLELGCDVFQGYLYSPPVPFETFLAMVREQEGAGAGETS